MSQKDSGFSLGFSKVCLKRIQDSAWDSAAYVSKGFRIQHGIQQSMSQKDSGFNIERIQDSRFRIQDSRFREFRDSGFSRDSGFTKDSEGIQMGFRIQGFSLSSTSFSGWGFSVCLSLEGYFSKTECQSSSHPVMKL